MSIVVNNLSDDDDTELWPYVLILTVGCIAILNLSNSVFTKEKELREREIQGEDVKVLAQEYSDFSWKNFKRKSYTGLATVFLIGFFTPEVDDSIVKSMTPIFMVMWLTWMAFAMSISGLIFTWDNKTTSIHAVTYTLGALLLIFTVSRELALNKSVDEWAKKVQENSFPA